MTWFGRLAAPQPQTTPPTHLHSVAAAVFTTPVRPLRRLTQMITVTIAGERTQQLFDRISNVPDLHNHKVSSVIVITFKTSGVRYSDTAAVGIKPVKSWFSTITS